MLALLIQMFLIGVGLSMDAFAVSISNGLSMKKITLKKALPSAVAFGVFQAVMPFLGYLLGAGFAELIQSFDHYIALVFLGFIGGKMIYDGIKELREDRKAKASGEVKPPMEEKKLGFWALIVQAVATSIDALVVGVSFVAMQIDFTEVIISVLLIGCTTFIISMVGVFMGKKFGELLGSRAEIVGGCILVAIGLKVFIEHVFFGG